MRTFLTVIVSALIGAGLTFIAAETVAHRSGDAPAPITLAVSDPVATDALSADYGALPPELSAMLTDAGYRTGASVPFGAAFFTESGMYLATADGWFACRHGVTAPVCSATGPVVPIGGVVQGDDVPSASPSGAPATFVEPDDGSAEYADGLMFDPESRIFRLPVREH